MFRISIVHSAGGVSSQTITLVIGAYPYRDRSCDFNSRTRALDRHVIHDTAQRQDVCRKGCYPEGVTATVTGLVVSEARTGSCGQMYTASRRE